jgi:hypothetical protein
MPVQPADLAVERRQTSRMVCSMPLIDGLLKITSSTLISHRRLELIQGLRTARRDSRGLHRVVVNERDRIQAPLGVASHLPTISWPKAPAPHTRAHGGSAARDAATRLMLRNDARVATIATVSSSVDDEDDARKPSRR